MDENGGLNTTAYVKGVSLLTEPHNQFSELCTLQRNILVDIPFEYNNKQGCVELQ